LRNAMNKKETTIPPAPLPTETIVAVATPPGEGGIGVVRISGPEALAYGRQLFSFVREPADIESQRLYVGTVVLPDDRARADLPTTREGDPGAAAYGRGRVEADRALFVLMRSPHSYTGEDVVELQCHGSPLLLSSIVTAAISLGARPADRGEFTRRAFMNGKIDLVQAEAVADLISAKTADGLAVFSRHLMGGFSTRLSELRGRLVSILADVEAAVDFSDQDIDPPAPETLVEELRTLRTSVDELAGSYRTGRSYSEGVRLVIVGRPNVGKSSLLNRLLGQPRAIVAPEPGTTTDTIEDSAELAGFPVRIVDTCGLREAVGVVEREGVRRTREALDTADVTLLVSEATVGLGPRERDVISNITGAGRALVVVMNKVDLIPGDLPEPPDCPVPVVYTSALLGTGIDDLTGAICARIAGGAGRAGEDELITSARQFAALVSASRALGEALAGAKENVPAEFVALDLRRALSALGEVTGEVTTDEILDAVFSRFCIGK
jgi:tRNA modification GTPase